MNKSSVISYSSINRAGVVRREYCSSCCGCRPWLRCKSCLKSCIRLPWSIILAILVSSVGIGLICFSLIQSTILSDQLTNDLFNRRYIWLNDLEVGIVILGFCLCLLTVTNLVIGCTTNAQKKPRYSFTSRRCYDNLCSPASNCIVKILFVINYLLLLVVIVSTLILAICLFAVYTTSSLCSTPFPGSFDGSASAETDLSPVQTPNQTRDSLNLYVFRPFIKLPQNETHLLILSGSRLIKFCDDLVPSALNNVQLCFTGLLLLLTGLLNCILTINSNWTEITTKRKFEEVVFLNSAEMATFDEAE